MLAVSPNNFNPRSPRGERRFWYNCYCFEVGISIHAPREGSDDKGVADVIYNTYFNPRSPRGERRGFAVAVRAFSNISIHAPREGSDRLVFLWIL